MNYKKLLRKQYEEETGESHGNALFSTTAYSIWLESQLEKEREVEIDFDGNVKALIQIKGNEIKVLKAMNGYGNSIDVNKITSKNK